MLVVSDFISWIGDDPDATRKILQADGRVSIVFADCYQGGDNLALVEAWDVPGPGYVNHTALVHNYGPARVVPITIRGPSGAAQPHGADGFRRGLLSLFYGLPWSQ